MRDTQAFLRVVPLLPRTRRFDETGDAPTPQDDHVGACRAPLVHHLEQTLYLGVAVALLVLTYLTCLQLWPLLWREQLMILKPVDTPTAHRTEPAHLTVDITAASTRTGSRPTGRPAPSREASSTVPGPVLPIAATSTVAAAGTLTAWRLLRAVRGRRDETDAPPIEPTPVDRQPGLGVLPHEPSADAEEPRPSHDLALDVSEPTDIFDAGDDPAPPPVLGSRPKSAGNRASQFSLRTGPEGARSSHGEILFERREHARVQLSQECALAWGEGKTAPATSSDLSEGGALLVVHSTQAPKLQAQVVITSLLPDGGMLHGRVLRRRELADGWEVALKFTSPSPDLSRDIGRVIDEAMTTAS